MSREYHRVLMGKMDGSEKVLTKDCYTLIGALRQRKNILETFDFDDNTFTFIESDYEKCKGIRSYYIVGSIKSGNTRHMNDYEINQLNIKRGAV